MTSSPSIWYPRVSHLSDASTRLGVSRSPSRLGSSPSCSSISCTSRSNGMRTTVGSVCDSWKLCWLADFIWSRAIGSLSFVVHVVTLRLPQPDARQADRSERGLEYPPRHDGDVFGRGVHVLEPRYVEVEILVI